MTMALREDTNHQTAIKKSAIDLQHKLTASDIDFEIFWRVIGLKGIEGDNFKAYSAQELEKYLTVELNQVDWKIDDGVTKKTLSILTGPCSED